MLSVSIMNSIGGREMKDKMESEEGGTRRFCDVNGLYGRINTCFYSLLRDSFSFVVINQIARQFDSKYAMRFE